MRAKSLQLCLTLCNPMDCSPPGFSVQRVLQARILEWVAKPFGQASLGSAGCGEGRAKEALGVWLAGWFLVRRTSVDRAEVRGDNPFPGMSPGSGLRGPWLWWAEVDFPGHDPSNLGDEGDWRVGGKQMSQGSIPTGLGSEALP